MQQAQPLATAACSVQIGQAGGKRSPLSTVLSQASLKIPDKACRAQV